MTFDDNVLILTMYFDDELYPFASDVAKMSSSELKQAILASEGRTICSENVVMAPPVAGDITNAEVASAYGADLILLNAFDCLNPIIL